MFSSYYIYILHGSLYNLSDSGSYLILHFYGRCLQKAYTNKTATEKTTAVRETSIYRNKFQNQSTRYTGIFRFRIIQADKDISKPSAAIASFHEMKFAVVARLFEGQSPEFQSHRRINPWNSNRCRVCEVFACSMNYTHKLRFTSLFFQNGTSRLGTDRPVHCPRPNLPGQDDIC